MKELANHIIINFTKSNKIKDKDNEKGKEKRFKATRYDSLKLICGGTFSGTGFICLLQTLPKFSRKLIETLFTGRLQVKLVEFGFL